MSKAISYNRSLKYRDHMINFISGYNPITEKCVYIKRYMSNVFKGLDHIHFQCVHSWKLSSPVSNSGPNTGVKEASP